MNEDLRRIKTYVGASGKRLRFQLRDKSTGEPLDLSSGYSSFTISARESGASSRKIDAATLTVESGTDGWVYFFPAPAGIDTAGDLRAQIQFVNSYGLDMTDKFIIEVEEPI